MKKLSTVFFLLLMPMMSIAQTGTIKARVIDARTGEPLSKATVQVLETKQGAFTKKDGFAVIKNITANHTYTVVSKYAGYMVNTQKNIRVFVNTTSMLEVRLESQRRTSCYFGVGSSEPQTTNEIITLGPGTNTHDPYSCPICNLKGNTSFLSNTSNSISKIHPSEFSIALRKIEPPDTTIQARRGTSCVIGCGFRSEAVQEKEKIELTSAVIKPVIIFPNPATTYTQLSFDVIQIGSIKILLYNIRGIVIKSYDDNVAVAGRHTTDLNLTDVPEGVYTVHIIQNDELRTGRFIVSK